MCLKEGSLEAEPPGRPGPGARGGGLRILPGFYRHAKSDDTQTDLDGPSTQGQPLGRGLVRVWRGTTWLAGQESLRPRTTLPQHVQALQNEKYTFSID